MLILPTGRERPPSPASISARNWSTETGTAPIKSRRWLNDPATMKQMDLLQRTGHEAHGLDFSRSKYAANCDLNFRWNRGAITTAVLGRAERSAA